MSRGPGARQRTILEAIQTHGAVFLDSLTADRAAEYKAFYRAACKLHDADKIGFKTFTCGAGPKVALYAIGRSEVNRDDLRRLHEQLRR